MVFIATLEPSLKVLVQVFMKAFFLVVCSIGVWLMPSAFAETSDHKSNTNSTSHSTASLQATVLSFTQADYDWLAARIYQNEGNSSAQYLTYWGEGETFPSLGIGHFIWFPENVNPPFKETFPALFEFLANTDPPPDWMKQITPFKAPWRNKREFDQAWSTAPLIALRNWLESTQRQQAKFIVQQFQKRWLRALSDQSKQSQVRLSQRLNVLLGFKKGRFAVIDYVNFKGVGGNSKEHYQGQEWGLMSVLNAMNLTQDMNQQDWLVAFTVAAKSRLHLRTQLAPVHRNEQRWIKGWFKRIEDYL